MKINELNQMLREMFTYLINNGYKKNHMCETTLGASANPQFDSFIKGQDLGSGPLNRMIDGLGFDLHLIPIKKDNVELQKMISDESDKFITLAKKDLEAFLQNKPTSRGPNTENKAAFAAQVEDMLKDLDI